MKLRILSLALCLVMLICAFASCSKKEDEDSDDVVKEVSSRTAVTLSMYVITEDSTTAEAAEAVEKEINSILKSKYTTKLEITYLTADEYYGKVEAQLEEMKKHADPSQNIPDAAESGTDTADTAPETEEELILNEHGVAEIKYPDLTPGQVDIIMIDDYAKYTEYVEKGLLSPLDSALSGASKKLGDYIFPTILDAAKIDGAVYAIPNNHPIGGETTYMTVDRELAKEFGLDTETVTSIADLSDFLAFAAEKGVTPIRNTGYEAQNVLYMGADADTRAFTSGFSLVGQFGKNSHITAPESLFANAGYTAQLLALAKNKFAGYYGTGANEKYAVEIKKGDLASMCADGENYDIVALYSEGQTKEQLCGTMLGVSKFSHKDNFVRIMEVITYINTNEVFRNLFQYGIEGTHYMLDEYTDEMITLSEDYNMDLAKTGNMLIAYPDKGMPANIWEMAKKQNLVTTPCTDSQFGDFKIPEDAEGETAVDFESAKALAKASSDVRKKLDSCTTYEEYEAFVKTVAETYKDVVDSFISGENTPCALYVAGLAK